MFFGKSMLCLKKNMRKEMTKEKSQENINIKEKRN